MDLYHFSEFVFPICELRRATPADDFSVHQFHGTGFAIGSSGYFLSAHHVIEQRSVVAAQGHGYIAALVTNVRDGKRRWEPVRVIEVERCQQKDVVIGKLERPLPGFFTSRNDDAYGWEDVHVFGYPDSLKSDFQTSTRLQFTPKFLKGYVTRRLESSDVLNAAWAPAYELSFPVPLGVSGSPVFRTGPDHSLLGIALASVESTLSVYERTDVVGPNETLRESVRKVEQVGLAARLHELRDWRPMLANGARLGELY